MDKSCRYEIGAAASAELHSHHPLAWVIRNRAKEMEIEIKGHAVCQVIVGRGMEAMVDGRRAVHG